ncbi:methyltransferase domain-containing protein [Halorarius litoreus]|uniref:methyltransferase domain-containing protein n=1 Tax=Halorarius litoreus TaxID=2962676 RepID=UPI0020CBEA0C|nr:methyltransferase domain-containing protein [Halorarius litoreus]
MKRAIRANFDESASAYDAYEARTGRFAALAERLAAEMEPRGRVLDAGAGTGASAAAFATSADALVALDASLGMLRENPTERRVVGDFDRLPFRDATFDAVAFTASLFLVPEPAAAVAEAKRILRPGGVVGAVALDGWTVHGGDALAGLDRESRSPASTDEVVAALDSAFETTTGTWSFDSSGDDLRAFHAIPALAARLYPELPTDERVVRATETLADVEGPLEQHWRWVVGRVA